MSSKYLPTPTDFARNNLSGPVPSCLGNVLGMREHSPDPGVDLPQIELVSKGREFIARGLRIELKKMIDLSSNYLHGTIPQGIANLSGLDTLNISHNQLTGSIPENIVNLQKLESLDLSDNHLSGSIPPTMSSMTLLNYLNLSHNDLSGEIPSANQFLTFNDPSNFEGNPGLCGGPLPKCKATTKNYKQAAEEEED